MVSWAVLCCWKKHDFLDSSRERSAVPAETVGYGEGALDHGRILETEIECVTVRDTCVRRFSLNPRVATHYPPSVIAVYRASSLTPCELRTYDNPTSNRYIRHSPLLSSGDSPLSPFQARPSRPNRAPGRNRFRLDRVLRVPYSCPVRDVCLTHS